MTIEKSLNNPDDELIRIGDAVRLLKVGKSTIYNKLNTKNRYYDSEFPRPIQIGWRTIAWRRSDLLNYIATRQAS
jgi:prophage regulatory protein